MHNFPLLIRIRILIIILSVLSIALTSYSSDQSTVWDKNYFDYGVQDVSNLQTPPQIFNETANQSSSTAVQRETIEIPPQIYSNSQYASKSPVTRKLPNFVIKEPIRGLAATEIVNYKKISLPESIEYGLSHNLGIIGNRLDINKASYDLKAAGAFRNPYIQYFLNGGKAATDNPNNVGMLFPLEIAKRGPRKKLAKSNLELTKGNVALAELNLRLDIRAAYIDLVAAKSVLKILGEQRKLIEDLFVIAKKKYDAGAAPRMDVIQAKMTLNQILIQENSAKTSVLVARYNFNKILDSAEKLGFDAKEDYLPEQKDFIFLLTPKPEEKMPEYDKVLDIAIRNRLDLKNAKQEVDVAQKNLVVAVRKRIPDFELGGGYIFVTPQLSTVERYTQGIYLAGNITNIPLLYQYTPEIKSAQIQVTQKELAYRNLEHQASMDLHSAYDSFNTAQTNLNYYNDVLLSESRQFLGMSKRSYEIGQTSITDFVFIEQSYKAIFMGYTNALADYYNSWIEVLRQVNDEAFKLNG